MIEIEIRKEYEFIKLDDMFVIQVGLVTVIVEVESQRVKKLHCGELVSYNGETVKIVR